MIQIICADSNEEYTIKEVAIDIVVSILERKPSTMQGNTTIVTSVFNLLMHHLISIESDIPDSWLKPSEGFNIHQRTEDSNVMIKFVVNILDRLMTAGEIDQWKTNLYNFKKQYENH